MKRVALAVFALLLLTTPAQAGFFDFLFGTSEDNATAAPPKPMFGGTMMNGGELLAELRVLKSGMSSPTPMAALQQLMIPQPPPEQPIPPAKAPKGKTKSKQKAALPEQAAAPEQKPQEPQAKQAESKKDPITSLFTMGNMVNDLLVNRLSSQMSYQAMDLMFGMMVDQPGLLSKVYVEVPDVSKLTPELRKRVLNMSAFMVALKASGMIVDASQKDFEAAKLSYKKLMNIRQKSAQAMADAYFKRNQAESLAKEDAAKGTMSLRPEDIAFLEQLGGAKPEDFVKDPRVQNLAVSLLKEQDPATYGQYTVEFTEMKSRYDGYARGVAGAASMLGFTYIFASKAPELINKQGAAGAVSMLPLVQQALPECLALAPRLIKVYTSGDESVAGSFSLVRGGKVEQSGVSAQKILNLLGEGGRKTLRDDLVANGPKGIMANLHLVAPATAAAMADKLIKKETKAQLAQHFVGEQRQFSFVDAQAGKCGSPMSYKQITQSLFFQRLPEPDAACKGETAEQALMLAQRDLRQGVADLENSDLRKIMFSMNANPADPAAPLVLADAQVRIDNLGIDGLLDQESIMSDRLKMHATEKSYTREAAGKKAAKGKRK
jgi:hypothetical protein